MEGIGRVTEELMALPRHVRPEKDRHGNPRLYYREGHGRRIRLWVMPGHPDWDKALEAAKEGREWIPGAGAKAAPIRVAPDTMRALVKAYMRSDTFLALDETTQKKRGVILEGCMDEPVDEGSPDKMGECPIKLFDVDHIKRLRRLKIATPEAANGRVKAMRRVFAWTIGEKKPMAAANPATEVELNRSTTGGWHTWTLGEVEQYWERWPVGTKQRMAVDIFLFSGLRISDAVRFGPPHVRKGWASIDQWKGRKKQRKTIEFPILPILQKSIDAYPTKGLTFIETEYGRPHSLKGLGNRIREWCDAANLPHCSAHGLRKAGATFAAENGASERTLMAIYKWDDPRQAAHYTKAANDRRLARDGMHLLMPTFGGDPSPEQTVEIGEGFSGEKARKING